LSRYDYGLLCRWVFTRKLIAHVTLQFAEKLYGAKVLDSKADIGDDEEVDIEAEIGAELKEMQKKVQKQPLLTNIRLDVMCGRSGAAGIPRLMRHVWSR
jgi:hypothetical protein